MRLDKYLSDCETASRSETKKLVRQGRIKINGKAAVKSSDKADEGDIVEIDGERVVYRKHIYLMMNKPKGYISAVYDKRLPTVLDLIGDEYRKFEPFPVGRLDIDTEGLLILSNDGDFAHRMTSPKKNVFKRYFAVLDREAEEKDINIFAAGIDLGDFTSKGAVLEICANRCEVYVEICEGKFHQVKRMFEAVGKRVVYLKRVKIGNVCLDESLPLGEVREMTADEISDIFAG